MIIIASSKLTLTTGIRDFQYNSSTNRTTARLNLDFRWQGSPTTKAFNDILGIVWSDDYIVNTNTSFLQVSFINPYYQEETSEQYTVGYSALNQADFKFPKHVSKHISGEGIRGYDISRGGGSVFFSDIERIPRIRTFSSYGYNYIKPNPGFTIGSGGTYGIGIDFDLGITKMDSDFQYDYLE